MVGDFNYHKLQSLRYLKIYGTSTTLLCVFDGGFDFGFVVYWFSVCYAAKQLATQLQQRCTQVVYKEARKRLTESNGTPAMDFRHRNVVLCFFF